MVATYRQTPLRRLGNILITPLARLGLAGKRTHILTVPGRAKRLSHATTNFIPIFYPSQLVSAGLSPPEIACSSQIGPRATPWDGHR